MASNHIEEVDDSVVDVEPWMQVLPMVSTAKEASLDMVSDILRATNVSDVLAMSSTESLRDLVGHTMTLFGATLRVSTLEESSGVYAVIDAQLETTGKETTITTGAGKVLAQLCKFQMLEAWPVRVKLIAITSKGDSKRKTLQFVDPEAF